MTTPFAKHSFPTDLPEKAATRERTLSLVREHSQFWHPTRQHLTCDWVELCGYDDETFKLLTQAGALKEGVSKYIGVNGDPAIIEHNKETFSSAEWVQGYWEDVMASNAYPKAGVIVFDGFNSVTNAHLDTLLAPTIAFAKRQHQRLGQALLVLNLALRGKASRTDAQVRYRALLEDAFQVPVTAEGFTTYTSKVTPMHICWVSMGF